MSNAKEDIIFQILDWDYYHEEEYDEDSDGNENEHPNLKYKIRLYGTTNDNKKINVRIDDFTPYFFVEIPSNWTKEREVKCLIDTVKNSVSAAHRNSLKEYGIVKKHKFRGFTNYKLFTYVRLIFDSYEGFRNYSWAFGRKIKHPVLGYRKYQLYESNIDPILRFMHHKDLKACGWAKLPKNKYEIEFSKKKSTLYDINASIKWEYIEPVTNIEISKFIIMAFDIECQSEDGSFPQPNRDGDEVIQIGATFSRFGESECFYKHIITLHSCDDIPGATVEWYDDERKVLLAFTKLVQKMNPDIVTGYNIFGFDLLYLKERAKKLGILEEFSKFSKVEDLVCKFEEKVLKSSALGENKLYYFIMNGRINIDLMKVVMRDYKLNSYKLDSVVSEFIKEKIKAVTVNENSSVIKTGNTYGLEVGRYIRIFFNDGLSDNSYKNDKKFKVVALTNDSITIDGVLDDEALEVKTYTVYWCQAKDDVHAHDIFRMQRGSSADRKTIAEYCLQDCVLCNKLIAKLNILTNNIGMSNVCHVPLSYIFLRGQSIKIFSLVAKKCRQRNHLIPVLVKKKVYTPEELEKMTPFKKKEILNALESEEEEEEEEGYEGATVFEPKIGVHFDPTSVLDYNSLYPSSMIERNISHECIVLDKQYDNLEGYLYVDVEYKNKDGSVKTCRYARKKNNDGTFGQGILPEILRDLLDARSNTRKLIASEPDKFKQKILDGLQLAYKVTANSLYGQTGASVSALYMKDLAASTTATGREMLNASKIFVEMLFKNIVDSILFSTEQDYRHKMHLLFTKQIDELLGPDYIKILKTHEEAFGEARYKYINVFIKNKDTIDDRKFRDTCFIEKNDIDHKNMQDFIDWLYITIKNLLKDKIINPDVIYGDTDSIFMKFRTANLKTGEILTDVTALDISIKLAIICSKILAKIVPSPQNMAYEKTFWPFIILTKKRYVGNKYESDTEHYYQSSMGIVLKRRDNAPIVKIVVGGIVNSILNDKSPKKAAEFTKNVLSKILSNKYQIDKYIISKTLKGDCSRVEMKKYLMDKYPDTKNLILKLFSQEYTKLELSNILLCKYAMQDDVVSKVLKNKMSLIDFKRLLLKTYDSEIDKKIIDKIFENRYTDTELMTIFSNKYIKSQNEIIKYFNTDAYANRMSIAHAVLADRMAERDSDNKPQSNDRISFAYIVTNSTSKLQGEHIENPEFIKKNNLQIDFLTYITNQIMNPAIQFLEQVIENPEKIFESAIIRETNKRAGIKPITYYFNLYHKKKIDEVFNDNDSPDEDDEKETNQTVDIDEYTIDIENDSDDGTSNTKTEIPVVTKTVIKKEKSKITTKSNKTVNKPKIQLSKKKQINTKLQTLGEETVFDEDTGEYKLDFD